MTVKTQTLGELIEPVVESFGLQLWGLQYVPHGSHALLRIYIDSEQGVGVEDCAKVSRQLSAVLDVEDPIQSKYTLEVSSPGLDRQLFNLSQYKTYIGKNIKLKLSRAIDGRKKFKAELISVDEEKQTIEIKFEEVNVEIEFINIEKANLIEDFV
jgi:ribosome maturation factor RimP